MKNNDGRSVPIDDNDDADDDGRSHESHMHTAHLQEVTCGGLISPLCDSRGRESNNRSFSTLCFSQNLEG